MKQKKTNLLVILKEFLKNKKCLKFWNRAPQYNINRPNTPCLLPVITIRHLQTPFIFLNFK
ncbi:pyridoxal kinase [Candidatus Phytoplasma rubi]|uniref:Pyridoxal kinase n=1 Tax=Candidatus Phytoplasma rubi TaxID=399025 RepID=A0ABY7BTZ9_9MOLU|nr:pyridoxal kinase [Candidatus Phytoplasma rubi]